MENTLNSSIHFIRTPLILLMLLMVGKSSFSQSLLFPEDYLFEQLKRNQTINNSIDTTESPAIFPFAQQIDSFNFYKPGRKWFGRKLFQDHFISISKNDTINDEVNKIEIKVDPLFNFSGGQEQLIDKNVKTYNNTRGVIASLKINQRLKLETSFIENQSVFPEYIRQQVLFTKDALGHGRWKDFKQNGFDYAMSSGVLWWQISKHVQLYAGHGKQKIGNGYRSFLLSDQAFNYPYIRFDFTFLKSKIHYTTTHAILMNLTPTIDINQHKPFGTESLLQKKPFSFQYLQFNLHKAIQFGLFQGIVWQTSNEKNNLNLSANYFNPIIFSNLGMYGFKSKPLIIAGGNTEIKLAKTFRMYFQLCTDGKKDSLKHTTSFGIQSGIKWFNAFTLKNLFFQLEYNEYSNALYQSNKNINQDAYSHYNQSLGFTFDTKSRSEAICFFAYRHKRMIISLKNNYFFNYSYSESTLLNEGKLTFILQPKTNMNVSVGFVGRNLHQEANKINSTQSKWLFISFATSLFNRYFDMQ